MKNTPFILAVFGLVVLSILASFACVQWLRTIQRLTVVESKVAALWAEPDVWLTSPDGKVLARLIAERSEYQPGETVHVFLEIINVSKEPLIMQQPAIGPWDLPLERDGIKSKYVGGIPEMAPPRPMTLVEHQTERVILTIGPEDFPDLLKEGAFVVTITYRSRDLQGDFWRGHVGPLKARWISRW